MADEDKSPVDSEPLHREKEAARRALGAVERLAILIWKARYVLENYSGKHSLKRSSAIERMHLPLSRTDFLLSRADLPLRSLLKYFSKVLDQMSQTAAEVRAYESQIRAKALEQKECETCEEQFKTLEVPTGAPVDPTFMTVAELIEALGNAALPNAMVVIRYGESDVLPTHVSDGGGSRYRWITSPDGLVVIEGIRLSNMATPLDSVRLAH